jgi:hypothetical protein
VIGDLMNDPFVCAEWTTRLLGVAEVYAAATKLGNWRDYTNVGAQSWNLVTVTRPRARNWTPAKVCLEYPGFLCLLAARLAAGVVLTIYPIDIACFAALGIVVVVTILMDWRDGGLGETASYRLQAVVSVALLLRFVAPESGLACQAILVFIGVNSVGSYFASFVVKLGDPEWRNGTKVFVVTNNTFLGNRTTAKFLAAFPQVVRALTWQVLAFELCFPLTLVSGAPLNLVLVSCGLLFHLINRILFQLPGFVLAYAVTYPAVIHVGGLIGMF